MQCHLSSNCAVRPAVVEDFPAIARLLVQLYSTELPGALSGPSMGQQQLLQFTLEARQAQGLLGRYVVCNDTGDVLATAVMEYPGNPRYERAPDGTIHQALTLIGKRATLRLLLTVARSMFPIPVPTAPDAVWMHSIIVDERQRGQGIGQALMTALEQQAIRDGYRGAWLQVLAGNAPAQRLYQRLGYTQQWTTPRWQRTLTWQSYLLSKNLLTT